MFELFTRRRFLPLFVTQFFGAFNDNFLKSAILVIVAYKSELSIANITMYNNLAMALFMLPYFFFSALAGQMSDKFDKAPYCRIVKLVEILLMILAAAALPQRNLPALLLLLFLMGAQSAFFGPAKYSLLPQHLKDRELVAGNAFIESGTFLAILLGTIFGSLLTGIRLGEYYSGALLVFFACIGYFGSRSIPPAPAPAPGLRISRHLPRETWRILQACFRHRTVKHTILALSLFWLIGSLFISQLPGVCRVVLQADNSVFTFFLALFSIGIGGGALVASLLLRGRISGRLAGFAALGMACFSFDFFLTTRHPTAGDELNSLGMLLFQPHFRRIALDLLAVSVCGGIFAIPLQALMQHAAPSREVARVVAGNNIVNSAYMAGGSILVAAAAGSFHLSIAAVFFLVTLLCLGNAAYSFVKFRN